MQILIPFLPHTQLSLNVFDFGCFIEVLEVYTSTKVHQKRENQRRKYMQKAL